MTKSSHPACRSLIPMHRPANPDPMMTTSAIAPDATRESLCRLVLQPVQDLTGVRDHERAGFVGVLLEVDGAGIEVVEVGPPYDVLRDAGRERDFDAEVFAGGGVPGAGAAEVGRVGEHTPVEVAEVVPLTEEVVAAVV